MKKIKEIFFSEKNMLKNFFYMAMSTSVGKIVLFAITPLLATFFSPEYMGEYQLFFSLCSIILIISCGGLDYPVLLESNPKRIHSLFILSMSFCFICVIIVLCTIYIISILKIEIPLFGSYSSLWRYRYTICLVFIISAFHQFFYYLCLKSENLKKLSIKHIIYPVTLGGFQVCVGYYYPTATTLVSGYILALGASAVYFIIIAPRKSNYFDFQEGFVNLKKTFFRYIQFFKKGTMIYFFNTVNGNSIFLLAPFISDSASLGYLSLCYKLLVGPAQVLTSSISGPFFSLSSHLSQGTLKDVELLEKKHKFYTIVLGVFSIFFLMMIPFYKKIFLIFFDLSWYPSVKFFFPLSFLVFFQVTFGSLHALGVYEKQNWQLLWEALRFMSTLIIVVICYYCKFGLYQATCFWSILGSLLYLSLIHI